MTCQETATALPEDILDMQRASESLREELEAITLYNLRIAGSKDETLKALLAHNRDEEKEHAAMLLEWMRRKDPTFSKELKDWLFTDKPFAHN